MRKVIVIMLVLSLMVVSVGFVNAQPMTQKPLLQKGSMMSMMSSRPFERYLDLDNDQKQDLVEMKQQYRAKKVKKMKVLAEKNRELNDLVLSGANNSKIIGVKADINNLRDDLLNIRINQLAEIKNILNQKQINKLKEVKTYFKVKRSINKFKRQVSDHRFKQFRSRQDFPKREFIRKQIRKNLSNLSEKQCDQIVEIHKEYHSQIVELRNEMFDKIKDLKELIQSKAAENKIENLKSDIANIKNAMITIKKEQFEELKTVLNQDQLKKLKKLKYFSNKMKNNIKQRFLQNK